MGLKHLFHSTKTDPTDPSIIGATKWNADHYYVDAAGAPIGTVGALLLAGAAGALTHLDSVAAGKVLTSAGVGALPTWATPAGVPAALVADSLTLSIANPDVVLSRSAANVLGLSGGLTLAAAGVLSFATRSAIRSASDGTLMLSNAAGTDFSMLRLGGITSAFPALRKLGASLQLVAADGNSFVQLTAKQHLLALDAGGGVAMIPTANGTLRLTNEAGNDFSLLQFGGTTNAFPALKRNGAALNVVTADASANGVLGAQAFVSYGGTFDIGGVSLIVGTGTPEGAVARPVGCLFLRTDGGTSTTLYVKQTGAATSTGWVAK